jgi:flagellar hook-associated protein 1
MSLTGAINTSLAGLQVTQEALQIVGANVANAQTPGYITKSLNQVATAAGQSISVQGASINRDLNTLVQQQLQQATSGGSYADELATLYQQLQTVFGQPGSSTGLDTLFNNFTTSMQTLAASPSSFSAQRGAVNAAQQLAGQLNSMSNSIQSMRTATEQGISADVQTANNDLQQIAAINQQVSTANAEDPTTATLLDQRDSYISQLSSLMDVKVIQGQFNQVSVFTGSGVQLVGAQAATLSFNAQGTLTPSSQYNSNPSESGVGTITLTYPSGGSTDLIAAGAIQSGQIAAYLQMRDTILPQAQTQLDEFASQISEATSNQTTAGTAVTSGSQTGFTVDTTALQNGNTINLTYTDSSNVQHQITIVRVDSASVLPLSSTVTNNLATGPNDTVIGVNFNGGTLSSSTVVAQLNAALSSTGLTFSNTGNTLQVLNNVANTVTVNSMSATTTATSTTSGSAPLPLFLDGSSNYTGAITPNGLEQTGYAQRITVNPALLTSPSDLVDYSSTTVAGDATRPNYLYSQLNNATLTFSPLTGIGSVTTPMTGTLSSYIGEVMTNQGQAAANATNLKQGQDVVVNSLQQTMNTDSGVDVDTQMTNLITLQNIYGANARVFSTVQQMFQTLLQM